MRQKVKIIRPLPFIARWRYKHERSRPVRLVRSYFQISLIITKKKSNDLFQGKRNSPQNIIPRRPQLILK